MSHLLGHTSSCTCTHTQGHTDMHKNVNAHVRACTHACEHARTLTNTTHNLTLVFACRLSLFLIMRPIIVFACRLSLCALSCAPSLYLPAGYPYAPHHAPHHCICLQAIPMRPIMLDTASAYLEYPDLSHRVAKPDAQKGTGVLKSLTSWAWGSSSKK